MPFKKNPELVTQDFFIIRCVKKLVCLKAFLHFPHDFHPEHSSLQGKQQRIEVLREILCIRYIYQVLYSKYRLKLVFATTELQFMSIIQVQKAVYWKDQTTEQLRSRIGQKLEEEVSTLGSLDILRRITFNSTMASAGTTI